MTPIEFICTHPNNLLKDLPCTCNWRAEQQVNWMELEHNNSASKTPVENTHLLYLVRKMKSVSASYFTGSIDFHSEGLNVVPSM